MSCLVHVLSSPVYSVRYGSAPQAPSCETSLLYEDVTDSIIEHRAELGYGNGSFQEPANVPEPGLDIIRPSEASAAMLRRAPDPSGPLRGVRNP